MQIQKTSSSSIIQASFMWIACACFYGYQYLLQVSPSVMTSAIMSDFHVNATALGNLAACYFYTYAAMQIPVGVFLDNFNTRKLLTCAAGLCTLGTLLFASSHIFAFAILGRLLIGLGGSFACVGCFYIAATWLPLRYFAFLNGLLLAMGMVGAIGGQAPLAIMVNNLHWRNTMLVFVGVGLAITLLLLMLVRNRNNAGAEKASSVTTATPPKTSILTGLKHVIHCKQSWLLAIYGGLMFMPVSVFGSLWGVPFLMSKFNITNATAGGLITTMFVGIAFGTPFFGWLSDHIKRRNPIMLISAIGALFSLVGVLYLPNISHLVAATLLFFFGFFTGGFLVCFAVIREIDCTNSPGTAIGFINMLNMVGGALLQPLSGWILDLKWSGQMAAGARVYSLANYQFALGLLPLGIAISMLMLPWIKETYCKSVCEKH